MERTGPGRSRRRSDAAAGGGAETTRRSGEDGFTVIEAAISMTVLAVALLSLFGTIVYCTRSNLAAAQKDQALAAAEAKIEELKSHPFHLLVPDYGPGGTIGPFFPVDRIDDGAGAQGILVFGLDETSIFGGPPQDLNGDGDADDTDVSADHEVLPLRVVITWTGVLGEQQLELRTLLMPEAGE